MTAGISVSWYRVLVRNPDLAGPAVVRRIARAVDTLGAKDGSAPPFLILSVYGGFLAALCPFFGVTPTEVRATSPQRGATASDHWRRCAHARQGALYLTHTALGVPQRTLATALALTPAAVCLALKSVETRRDDPAFEAALEAAQRDVTGGLG